MRADGFFVTGDMATMDETGRAAIVGRAKDLIIPGGLNIYPREVELALDAVPGVGESAVIGVPHPDLGEAAVAIVVRTEPALDEAALLQAAPPDPVRRRAAAQRDGQGPEGGAARDAQAPVRKSRQPTGIGSLTFGSLLALCSAHLEDSQI